MSIVPSEYYDAVLGNQIAPPCQAESLEEIRQGPFSTLPYEIRTNICTFLFHRMSGNVVVLTRLSYVELVEDVTALRATNKRNRVIATRHLRKHLADFLANPNSPPFYNHDPVKLAISNNRVVERQNKIQALKTEASAQPGMSLRIQVILASESARILNNADWEGLFSELQGLVRRQNSR